jgi:hypothetical protein
VYLLLRNFCHSVNLKSGENFHDKNRKQRPDLV